MIEKTIRISQEDYNRILHEAEAVFPEEACGLLAGYLEGEIYEVRKVYAIENREHSPNHFIAEPEAHLAAIEDIRKSGFLLIGNWHSHPAGSSYPSEEDKRLAFDRKSVHMILSLEGGQAILNAFHMEGKEVRRENLVITK